MDRNEILTRQRDLMVEQPDEVLPLIARWIRQEVTIQADQGGSHPDERIIMGNACARLLETIAETYNEFSCSRIMCATTFTPLVVAVNGPPFNTIENREDALQQAGRLMALQITSALLFPEPVSEGIPPEQGISRQLTNLARNTLDLLLSSENSQIPQRSSR